VVVLAAIEMTQQVPVQDKVVVQVAVAVEPKPYIQVTMPQAQAQTAKEIQEELV
jgi:hypothetical protein